MLNIHTDNILLADGWHTDKTLSIEHGIIKSISDGCLDNAEHVDGSVIPGMVNCHSHAFQRAFAGFSEQGSEGKDSFWTWRKIMYQFLGTLSTNDVETIATQLYIEMLKAGYTRVAEFHYLHHDIDGQNYPELSCMSKAIFKAAQCAGIGLTLLPVLYCFSGFGAQKPRDEQKRFINSPAQFNQLVSDCFALSKHYPNSNVGIAPHSLRAVDKSALENVITHVRSCDPHAPIHIHIAEQQKELNDCLNHYGKRPVQWLLDNIKLDRHWCLIHATHIDKQERQGIIASQAVAGICPTTEANLGDGIFPAAEFIAEQGTVAIGSDSHISVNPIEELRWLEYTQRLSTHQRAILADSRTPSTGLNLWQKAALGGAQSTNSNTGVLSVGKQADLLVLDPQDTMLFAHSHQHIMDSMLFASQRSPVKDVMVNGRWLIKNRQHDKQSEARTAFSHLLEAMPSS